MLHHSDDYFLKKNIQKHDNDDGDDEKNDFDNKSYHRILINIMAPQSDFQAHCPLFVRFSQASRTNFVDCTYKLRLSSSCGIEVKVAKNVI